MGVPALASRPLCCLRALAPQLWDSSARFPLARLALRTRGALPALTRTRPAGALRLATTPAHCRPPTPHLLPALPAALPIPAALLSPPLPTSRRGAGGGVAGPGFV